MPFKLGLTEASDLKLGTTDVTKLMIGTTQIWPSNPPGPPTGVNASVDESDVTLTWSAPVFTGDFPITDYVIQRGSLIAFQDDFNRANSSDLGANWTPAGEYGPLQIVSNKAKAVTSGVTAVEEYQTAMASNDHWGMVTVNLNSGDTFFGLLLRGTGSGPGRAEVGFEINPDNRYELVEFIAGEHITRAQTAVDTVPTAADRTIRGEVIGNQAYYYVNGVLTLTATLTTQLAGTRVRLGCTDQSGSATTTLDDVRFGGFAPTSWTTVTDAVSTATSAILPAEPAGRWVYRVAAVNAGGQGAYSAQSNGVFVGIDEGPAGPTVPAPPTTVLGTAGDAQVALTWTAPSSDGGSALTDYVVQWALNSAPTSWTTFTEGTSTTAAATVSGLTNGTAYIFRVAAVNAIGQSPYSTPSSAYSPAAGLTVPDAPTGLTAVAGDGEVDLSWTAPVGTGGTAITDYVIQYRPTSGGTGLAPDRSDNFNRANAVITTPWTQRTAGTWSVDTNTARPTNVATDALIQHSTRTDLSGYVQATVRADDAYAGLMALIESPFRNEVYFIIHGGTLAYALGHQINSVDTILEQGGHYSAGTTVEMRLEWDITPGVETVLRGYVNDVLTCDSVSTKAPAGAYGVGMGGYQISASAFAFDDWESGTFGAAWTTFSEGTGTGTTATVTGLTNGVEYEFQVAAVNALGTGAYSATDNATPSGTATVPGAPTALAAVAGNAQVALTWTAPADNGGSALTDYVVQWRTTAGPGSWNTFSEGTSTATAATVTGLTNGTSYDFQVAAVNAIGTGAYSATDTETPTAAAVVPGAPTALDAVAGDAQAVLTWTAPASDGGAAITDYIVQYRTTAGPGTWTTFSDAVSATTGATVTGLTNGTAYDFQVAAINTVGTGPYSATDSATPATPWPIVAASNTDFGASLGAANAIPAPAGVVAGNLLLAIGVNDNTGATDLTGSTGWTRISHTVQGSNILKLGVFARIADGGANDAFALTGAAQDFCATIHRITNHAVVNVATDIHIAAFASTANGNADPPNLAPGTARHFLWLTAAGVDATTGNTITGVPSGYTQIGSTLTSASSTSSCLLAVAQKNADITSDNPGTFTNTSRAFIAVTIAIPKDVVAPAAPTLAAGVPGDGQVALTWTPGSTGGSAITDYIVEYRTTAGPGSWNVFSEGTSTTAAATVTGLTNDTGYDFRVSAVSAAGTSATSNVVTSTPTGGGGGPNVVAPIGYWNGTTTGTSASISVQTGDIVVVGAHIDSDGVSPPGPPTNTGSLGTWQSHAENRPNGAVRLYSARALANGSVTVTFSSSPARFWASGYVVRGAHATDWVGVTAGGNSTTTPINPSLTAEQADSLLVVIVNEWNERGTPTSTDLTELANDYAGWTEAMVGHKAIAAAGANSFNLTAGGGGAPAWSYAYLEILKA